MNSAAMTDGGRRFETLSFPTTPAPKATRPERGESPRSWLGINPAAVFVICAIGLTCLGLTVLFSASASFKQGPYYYLNKQLLGVALATVTAWIVSRIDFEHARRYVLILAGVSVLMLVLVLIPGVGIDVKGSKRWLGHGMFRLQVSEVAKLVMVFCLAHYLAINQSRLSEGLRGFLFPVGIVMGFAALIAKEPDLGTAALVVAVGLVMLFLAGARWLYLVPCVIAAAIGFAAIVVLIPNRLQRFMAYLDVEGNKQRGTYQLYQSLSAFAAGGTEGAGLGQGRQQLNFLPEAQTDFIFAVVGEELGMWATLAVVATFALMFVAGIIHLRKAPNLFQFLLFTGCLLMMTLQAVINLGVVTGLLPTKGMSLPFISAGLSNLLLMGAIVGVFINTQRAWARPALDRTGRAMEELSG